MLLVLLDAFHLGDPLFIPQLARDAAARKEGTVFVHGSGEAGERAIEALGGIARQVDGVWQTTTPAEAADVERATRDLNRRLVHEMNEAGAPAVRVMAADRGLVARAPGGTLRAGRTAWLETLVRQNAVPVIASLIDTGADALQEADPAGVAAVLADALGASAVVLLQTGRTPGVPGDGGPRADASLAEARASLPDAALAERLVTASRTPVFATTPASLRAPGRPVGTQIRP